MHLFNYLLHFSDTFSDKGHQCFNPQAFHGHLWFVQNQPKASGKYPHLSNLIGNLRCFFLAKLVIKAINVLIHGPFMATYDLCRTNQKLQANILIYLTLLGIWDAFFLQNIAYRMIAGSCCCLFIFGISRVHYWQLPTASVYLSLSLLLTDSCPRPPCIWVWPCYLQTR